MKNLDEISQSFRKRACFRLIVSLKKSYKLKNSDRDALHNKIFSHFKPMKTWLILTWGGWKSKWGKEFFLPWGQQNFIQGQPAPHKYGTIPHQQGASCTRQIQGWVCQLMHKIQQAHLLQNLQLLLAPVQCTGVSLESPVFTTHQ